jgi:hypothetical protein
MPFCPNCRYEYVGGAQECPDCGAKLVEALPQEHVDKIDDVRIVTVGVFPSQIQADMARIRLEAEGIEAAAIMSNPTWRTPGVFVPPISPGFRVQVREEDAARAAEILREDEEK